MTTSAVHMFKLLIFSSDFTNTLHLAFIHGCHWRLSQSSMLIFHSQPVNTLACWSKRGLSLSHLQPYNELKYPIPESAVYGRSSASIFFSLKYWNVRDQSQRLCGVFCGTQEINSRTEFEADGTLAVAGNNIVQSDRKCTGTLFWGFEWWKEVYRALLRNSTCLVAKK